MALSLRAIVRYYHGQTPDAVRLGEQALAEVGDAPGPGRTVLCRAAFLVAQLDLERAYDLVGGGASDPRGRCGDDVDPDLLANVLLLHASAALGLVRGIDTAEIERGTRLISEAGRAWEHDGADGIAFGLARQTGRPRPGDRDDRTTHPGQVRPGRRRPVQLRVAVRPPGLPRRLGGGPGERRGRPSRATPARAPTSSRHGGCAAWRWSRPTTAGPTRLDDSPTEGLELAIARGDLALQIYHRHILGFIALSLGDHRTADGELTIAGTLAEASGTRHPGRFKVDGDRLEAALGVGDLERAARHRRRSSSTSPMSRRRRGPSRSAPAVAGSSRRRRATSTRPSRRSIRALVEHERLPMPFERGRTLLAKGQVHRRRKEKRLADERLHEALAIFESLGAPLWADRATAELARIGLRPRAPADLTATERRVAELAATGLSSRQIAEQAFLAPKTVGNVLGRVYEKLGIHSRAELGARMGQGTPGDASGD